MAAADMPMANVSRPARHQGVGDQRLRSEPMEKKVSAGQQGRGLDRGRQAEDEGQQRNRSADDEGQERGERRPERRAVDRRQAVLLRHHGLDPAVLLFGDDVDDGVQRLALEALGLEDLPDLLALSFRRDPNVPLLHAAHLLIFLDLGLGAGEIGGRHRKTVGDEIGGAEDQKRPGREIGADHAGNHGEGGHRAVDAAIDPVAQITDARPVAQALGDFARVVAVLEMPGIHAALLTWRGPADNGSC